MPTKEQQRAFEEEMELSGYRASRCSGPEYLLHDEAGRFRAFVFVTSGKRALRAKQQLFVDAAIAEGVPCAVWSPVNKLELLDGSPEMPEQNSGAGPSDASDDWLQLPDDAW